MLVKKCLGCPKLFEPKRQNQFYHSQFCQRRANKKPGPRARYSEPPLALANAFTEAVMAAMPRGAVGFRLFCRELDITLPWPGSPRRDGTRPKSADFGLYPSVELPLLPLLTTYQLVWIMPGAGVVPAQVTVTPGWADKMTKMGEVGRLLRLYRSRRRQAQAQLTAEMKWQVESLHHAEEAQKRKTAQLPAPTAQLPPLTADQEQLAPPTAGFAELPPHDQGHTDSDSDTT